MPLLPGRLGLLRGSWDLVSKVRSTLTGVISIVTLFITLLTKSRDPLSVASGMLDFDTFTGRE